MSFLSDFLLAGGAFGAAFYCLVLSRRLRALTALDSSMGTAVAVLSAQVDDLTRALAQARETAQSMTLRLGTQTERAETACRRLELLVASLHDLPAEAAEAAGPKDRPPPAPVVGRLQDPAPTAVPVRSRVLRRRAEGQAA